MEISLSQKCSFCNSILHDIYRFQKRNCPNYKCKSHFFVIGNQVYIPKRQELGFGKIIDIIPIENKEKSVVHTKYRYLIEFKAYIEKSLYLDEISHYLWDIDDKITTNFGSGTIIKRNLHESYGIISYSILTSDSQKLTLKETDILDQINDPLTEYFKGNLSNSNQFLLRLWGYQIHNLYTSNLLKIITHSRLSLLPHQISVAHHLLEEIKARYILADEVGLGKTIEAGIYIKEMIARNLASRILVITPASITGQWEFELKNKFNLDFTRLSSKLMKKINVDYNSGTFVNNKNGESYKLCTVTLQYARLRQCANILNKIEWDIIIFDEAHHLRRYLSSQSKEQYRTTLAYELAQNLSQKTSNLLLLTATPIQLHSFDLYSLIALLNPFEFPTFEAFEASRKEIPFLNLLVKNLHNFKRLNSYERKALIPQLQYYGITQSESELEAKIQFQQNRMKLIKELEKKHFLSRYIIRNRRRIVFPNHPIKRIPKIINIKLSEKEFAVYNKIHLYLAKIYSQNFESGPKGIGFVMVILQKLLTSSVPAILKSLKNRISYLEKNKDILLKLSTEQEFQREFTEDESSLDLAWGLDDLDLEDRMTIQSRKRKISQTKKSKLDINTHITILKEFVKDLQSLILDSKASKLLEITSEILNENPNEKIIIFTQFKQTLFYLKKKIEENGYKVSEFHGDLSESQKKESVTEFKYKKHILLSTEIGGEGRNFQFCHILINYDLPWNPMKLEQRIGRLDRFGQTKDIFIYNFFIQDTVESNIITAIAERIHLFEESIGALEPILGTFEGKITNLVLKKDSIPVKFRFDELLSKTTNQIEQVYDKLEDLILDKRSFQFDYISEDLNRNDLLTGIDIFAFIIKFSSLITLDGNFRKAYPDFNFSVNLSSLEKRIGIWQFNLSESLRQFFRIPQKNYKGTFDIDLARKQEEFDFFSIGHPLIMKFVDWAISDNLNGFCSEFQMDLKKFKEFFTDPYGVKMDKEEQEILANVLEKKKKLHLYIFEIEFFGIVVEKNVVPVILTSDNKELPMLAKFIYRPHNFQKIIISNDQNLDLNMHLKSIDKKTITNDNYEFCENLKKSLIIAKQATKKWINLRVKIITELNKKRYILQKAKTIKNAEHQKNFALNQIKNAELSLRAKKLKLPTQRQMDNLEKINDLQKKKKRLQDFEKRRNDVKYYESEINRWNKILENLEFDVPSRLTRLKKHRKLRVNANMLAFAIINIK